MCGHVYSGAMGLKCTWPIACSHSSIRWRSVVICIRRPSMMPLCPNKNTPLSPSSPVPTSCLGCWLRAMGCRLQASSPRLAAYSRQPKTSSPTAASPTASTPRPLAYSRQPTAGRQPPAGSSQSASSPRLAGSLRPAAHGQQPTVGSQQLPAGWKPTAGSPRPAAHGRQASRARGSSFGV